MSLSRTLYSDQNVSIAGLGILPVKSASIERSVPVENVLTLGKKGAHSRQIKEIEKFTINVKTFITRGGSASATAGPRDADVKKLVTDAGAGTLTEVSLNGGTNNGFKGQVILTKFAIDASIGDFPTVDFTFEGLGAPSFTGGNISSTNALQVCDSSNVSLTGPGAGIIKSAKFNLDIPTEMLTTFGASLTQTNDDIKKATAPQQKYKLLSKLPLKYSMTIEGENVTRAATGFTIGPCAVSITDGVLQSESINQNAGDLGAVKSFTVEGTIGNLG